MTDLQASIGVAQLDRLDDFVATRRRNFALLKEGLAAFEDRLVMPEATANSDPSWFGFPLTMRETGRRDDLVKFLNERRIGTRLLFGGNLTRQPYMLGREFRVVGDLPSSETVMRDTFWIGVYPGIEPAAVDYVIESVGLFFAGAAS